MTHTRTAPDALYREIALACESGKTLREVAAQYGVSHEWVRQIRMGNVTTSADGIGQLAREARAKRAEAASRKRWGMSREERARFRAATLAMLAAGVPHAQTPHGRFIMQTRNDRRRGIPWCLTLGAWWRIWQDSGKWDDRGRAAEAYVMARKRDKGAYQVGNVEIVTVSANCSEGQQTRKRYNTERGKP